MGEGLLWRADGKTGVGGRQVKGEEGRRRSRGRARAVRRRARRRAFPPVPRARELPTAPGAAASRPPAVGPLLSGGRRGAGSGGGRCRDGAHAPPRFGETRRCGGGGLMGPRAASSASTSAAASPVGGRGRAGRASQVGHAGAPELRRGRAAPATRPRPHRRRGPGPRGGACGRPARRPPPPPASGRGRRRRWRRCGRGGRARAAASARAWRAAAPAAAHMGRQGEPIEARGGCRRVRARQPWPGGAGRTAAALSRARVTRASEITGFALCGMVEEPPPAPADPAHPARPAGSGPGRSCRSSRDQRQPAAELGDGVAGGGATGGRSGARSRRGGERAHDLRGPLPPQRGVGAGGDGERDAAGGAGASSARRCAVAEERGRTRRHLASRGGGASPSWKRVRAAMTVRAAAPGRGGELRPAAASGGRRGGRGRREGAAPGAVSTMSWLGAPQCSVARRRGPSPARNAWTSAATGTPSRLMPSAGRRGLG